MKTLSHKLLKIIGARSVSDLSSNTIALSTVLEPIEYLAEKKTAPIISMPKKDLAVIV